VAALVLYLVRKVNNKLSESVANNWTTTNFIKSQELVLITGGSSGIGELMAKEFSKKGVKVVIIDVNPPKADLPSNVFFYESDVTSTSKIAATAAAIRKDHGDPTVLVNNAGIGQCKTILDSTEESIQKIFEVNTISHFWMTREFLPAMVKKNHGHVVTIASMAAYVTIAQNVDYSCTKASAVAFHEGLASELRARYKAPKVRTTLVNPSWVRTPLIQDLIDTPGFTNDIMDLEVVVQAIVDQVVSGKSGHLILPKRLNLASSVRGWPTWMRTLLTNSLQHSLENVKRP